MDSHGVSNRVFLKSRGLRVMDNPSSAVAVWTESGVHGRTLILFDKKLNARHDASSLTDTNYNFVAIRRNIVRKIYHVIPDSLFPQVEETIKMKKNVGSSQGVYRMTIEGAPLFVMRMKDIPPDIGEEALVQVNGDSWDEGEMLQIAELIERGLIKSDLLTLSGAIPDAAMSRLRHVYE